MTTKVAIVAVLNVVALSTVVALLNAQFYGWGVRAAYFVAVHSAVPLAGIVALSFVPMGSWIIRLVGVTVVGVVVVSHILVGRYEREVAEVQAFCRERMEEVKVSATRGEQVACIAESLCRRGRRLLSAMNEKECVLALRDDGMGVFLTDIMRLWGRKRCGWEFWATNREWLYSSIRWKADEPEGR